MAGKCTSRGNCAAGFRECGPCPFTEKDFQEGVIEELDPIIESVVTTSRRTGQLVGSLVYELGAAGLVGNEPHQVRAAAEAKLA